MSDTDKKTEDQKFNDTLKRMLKTPPKPHDEKKEGGKNDGGKHSKLEEGR